ncbi:hypothetical protein BO70DRAFT_2079 [Aspergillus heteromorphus CBS 117.55]|uniref:Uncharacterized protein n=1 Tax=Aspergillus heteromorphus CBS 117.55 TaxID=1448321 RepID=A0A317X671_9EURO|nr:uncharacterized protein BO70DRAFT_2079 [Aspergillus heteromorphus CBS 117.55]PWY92070.1 hypothetical protein BO70DRAFT_2079 [Aspergillus heteromorphus CBS 117.55]
MELDGDGDEMKWAGLGWTGLLGCWAGAAHLRSPYLPTYLPVPWWLWLWLGGCLTDSWWYRETSRDRGRPGQSRACGQSVWCGGPWRVQNHHHHHHHHHHQLSGTEYLTIYPPSVEPTVVPVSYPSLGKQVVKGSTAGLAWKIKFGGRQRGRPRGFLP